MQRPGSCCERSACVCPRLRILDCAIPAISCEHVILVFVPSEAPWPKMNDPK